MANMATVFMDSAEAEMIGENSPINFSTRAPINYSISICYPLPVDTINPLLWDGTNTLQEVSLCFICQVTVIVTFTRLVGIVLKPLRQPKVVADILGGILLGPSLLGKWQWYMNTVFPYSNTSTLQTMSNLSLLLFMFLVGVEMDLGMLKQTGKKATVIAFSSMTAPFIIGVVFGRGLTKTNYEMSFLLFFGVTVSVTAFPVLARVLAELKLLNTEVGRMALSSALINDVFAWFVIVVAAVLADDYENSNAGFGILLNYVVLMLFSFFIVQPLVHWVARRTPDGEMCNEVDICLILIGVFLFGFFSDILGIPSLFGAFVYGLIIPIGPLGAAIVENLEDFVFGLLLPLFFAANGLSTNLTWLIHKGSWLPLLAIVGLAGVAKTGITLLIAIYYKIPFQDGVALGLLMNTKGLVEIIFINLGKELEVLDDEAFSTMVLLSVITTCIVTPLLMMFYRPARQALPYKKRSIQSLKPSNELRVLACLYAPRNVATTINLLEAAQPTTKSPIYVYALHLMELTDRGSSMLLIHNIRRSGGVAFSRIQAQSDYIINTFEDYKRHEGILSIEPLNAISPFSTMHADIRNTAEERRASFIILPFHKQQTIDGEMETTNPAYRAINQNILAKAPCSVGVLVDRNLGSSKITADGQISLRVVVFFLGGPDDREALAYASRMVENPSISLTVIRFLPGEEATESPILRYHRDEKGIMVQSIEEDSKTKIDDDFINTFLTKNMNKTHISFTEKIVNNGVETVDVIRSMGSIYDLYIVGRGQGETPLTTGLTDWSECPELGIIGDILASPDFVKMTSVLVVQQYPGA